MASNFFTILRKPKYTPGLIIAIYVIFGLLWAAFLDTLLLSVVSDPATIARLEVFKGWFYVITTAFLLYVLIHRGMNIIGESEMALRESEEQFRQLAEHIQEVFWITDVEQETLIYISPIFEKVWGISCEILQDWPECWFDMIHTEDRERVRGAYRKQVEGNYDEEYRILCPDGSVRWIRDRAFPIQNEQDEVQRICGIIQDTTERMLAKRTLEQQVEERTRETVQRQLVAEGLRDILAVLNSNRSLTTILDYIASQAERLLGADAVAIYRQQPGDDVLTIQVERGLEPDYVIEARIPVGQSITGRAVLRQEPVSLSDISTVSTEDLALDNDRMALLERLGTSYRALLAVPLGNEHTYGAITLYYREPREFSDEEVSLVVSFSDQAALAISNASLRSQIEKRAVEAERGRLARDLHDSVTQTLFSASMTADVLPIIWERDQVEGRQALEDLRELTLGALAEMRTLLLELRPAVLMKAKLDQLLRQLAEAITGRSRVPVTVDITSQCELPPEVHVALYRIAQEALNNVAKHAKATQVVLSLECSSPPSQEITDRNDGTNGTEQVEMGKVELEIHDDGCGFSIDYTSPDNLGLSIMRERAQSIGALLTIESQPGRGTHVAVIWPNS